MQGQPVRWNWLEMRTQMSRSHSGPSTTPRPLGHILPHRDIGTQRQGLGRKRCGYHDFIWAALVTLFGQLLPRLQVMGCKDSCFLKLRLLHSKYFLLRCKTRSLVGFFAEGRRNRSVAFAFPSSQLLELPNCIWLSTNKMQIYAGYMFSTQWKQKICRCLRKMSIMSAAKKASFIWCVMGFSLRFLQVGIYRVHILPSAHGGQPTCWPVKLSSTSVDGRSSQKKLFSPMWLMEQHPHKICACSWHGHLEDFCDRGNFFQEKQFASSKNKMVTMSGAVLPVYPRNQYL